MKKFLMLNWGRGVITVALLVLMFSTLAYGQHGVSREPLTGVRSALWSDRVIDVCWENPQNTNVTERTWVRNAVQREWENNSNIRLVGWNACTTNNPGIRISIEDVTPHTKSLGARLDGDENGMVLNLTFSNWAPHCAATPQFCIEAIAVHEFGHALGFTHEHNRRWGIPFNCSDERQGTRGGWLITPYDLDSVMNYCNPDWNGNGRLSHLDIIGLQKAYGAPGQSLNQDPRWYVSFSGQANWVMINISRIPLKDLRFGDFNGDGRTDVFRTNDRHFFVSWAGSSSWDRIYDTALAENNEIALGDFNGDDRTDVFVSW